jgi:hypothetical protein
MKIGERLGYALIGLIVGSFLGVICWWLYGLAHSRQFYGVGIDPSIRHWVGYMGGVFAVLGFLFREGAGDSAGNALQAIFDFEEGSSPGRGMSLIGSLVFLAFIGAAIWFAVKYWT